MKAADWKCVEKLAEGARLYHYKGCGLDDIYLVNGYELTKASDGEEEICINDLDGLHRTIGERLVIHKKDLSGKELRFLRKQMDLTQSELARFIGLSVQQVARWEKNQCQISGPADYMLRALYLEEMQGKISLRKFLKELDGTDTIMEKKQLFTEEDDGWKAAA